LAPWPSVDVHGKFYGDRSRETPLSDGRLNGRGVAKYEYIAILDLSKAISPKRCKIEGKLVLITNRKSYMSFRLVSKSLTLNDLERHNDRYFTLFQRIRYNVVSGAHYVKVVEGVVVKKFTFAIASPDEVLVHAAAVNGSD